MDFMVGFGFVKSGEMTVRVYGWWVRQGFVGWNRELGVFVNDRQKVRVMEQFYRVFEGCSFVCDGQGL